MKHELTYHEIRGIHWGIRRFQNKDGSLTEAGRVAYKKTALDKVEARG